MQGKELECEEDDYDGQQCDCHFSHVFGQVMQVGSPNGGSIGEGGSGDLQSAAAFGIEEAEDQYS